MELLNLMQGGDPMQRAFAQMNPNPQMQQQQPTQAPPRPPGGPSAPGGMPGAIPPAQPPQQPPAPPSVAPQSPPDLAQLYMQMAQRERSANAIDKGLALMASAYAAPGTQGQIMHSMDNMNPDPATQLSNMVALENMQRMNAARPAIIASLSGGQGGQGGMDPALLAGMSTDQLQKIVGEQAAARIGIQTKGAETEQQNLLEARQKSPLMNTQLTQMDQLASQISGMTNADGTPALQGIMSSAIKREAAEKLLEADPDKGITGAIATQIAMAQFTPQEQAALQRMKTLDNQVYGQAFESTGSRRTGQEVANLRTGLSPLKNFNQPFGDYMTQFSQFQDQLHKSIANNLGAAQELDQIPEAYRWDRNGKPNVDQSYLPGGNLYAGSGGQWASNPPKQQGAPTITGPGAAYDALPKGAIYVGPDGQQYRKS